MKQILIQIFQKKYNVSNNRRNENRHQRKQQAPTDNPRIQKIGELNFDIALQKSKHKKTK